MMPWDVPGGIVGCYMSYGGGDRAIKLENGTEKTKHQKDGDGKRTARELDWMMSSLFTLRYPLPTPPPPGKSERGDSLLNREQGF